MPVNNYFDTPFAENGDKTAIPDGLDPSGNVSYDQGYTSDYALPSTDPSYKTIERDKFNSLMNQVTLAIQQYQQHGTPPFITSVMNGGTPYSYSKYDRVLLTGVVYTSLTNGNTDTPPSSNWTDGTPVANGGTGLSSITAHNLIVGNGTSNATLLPPSAASGIPLVSQGSSADPAYTTVAIAGGGTSATTAAGARSSLGVAPFVSAQQTLTLGGTLTIAHGLGAAPARVTTTLVCQSSSSGYTTGQVIYLPNGGVDSTSGDNWGAAITADSSNIYIKYAATGYGAGTVYTWINNSTGAEAQLPNANFKAVFTASII